MEEVDEVTIVRQQRDTGDSSGKHFGADASKTLAGRSRTKDIG